MFNKKTIYIFFVEDVIVDFKRNVVLHDNLSKKVPLIYQFADVYGVFSDWEFYVFCLIQTQILITFNVYLNFWLNFSFLIVTISFTEQSKMSHS